MKTLRLILGDQLNEKHSWYNSIDPEVSYLLMELRQETTYVTHHIQKILGFFEAMSRFSGMLESKGHSVIYLTIEDLNNTGNLAENIVHIINELTIERFEYQLPDEYRLDEQLNSICDSLKIPYLAYDTEHFITTRNELGELFLGKKQLLMESFYRVQRKKTGILMNNDHPIGDKWNFDHDNRAKFEKDLPLPPPSKVLNNLTELYERIKKASIPAIGNVVPQKYCWPVDRTQAIIVLQEFLDFRLPYFGTYQDSMTSTDDYLFHSRLSFALNIKLINPLEVIQAVEKAYFENSEKITINQSEGFIRQILGWREYMRGIYWLKMPEFAELNYFEHTRKLPEWFWTGETKMNCLSHSIQASLDNAYAHHIQRLMVTGNFALLAGINPDEVDAWYLGIYIDAIEWVEITNTRGMSQFADGGIVGTKPYVSSAAYIDKMGDYCSNCFYDKKEKLTENACPFNSLYWHFYERNRSKLERNPRIGMMYKTWDKMEDEKKMAIIQRAEDFLNSLDQ